MDPAHLQGRLVSPSEGPIVQAESETGCPKPLNWFSVSSPNSPLYLG